MDNAFNVTTIRLGSSIQFIHRISIILRIKFPKTWKFILQKKMHALLPPASVLINVFVPIQNLNYSVKQRLQMFSSPYRGVFDCIRRVYAEQGIAAFYRSYTTQLTMNIPFQSLHFMAYEASQNITNPSREYNPKMHMLSGALAGGIAAALTTPLDVCKTLLNTQSDSKIIGLTNAIKAVYKLGGPLGFFKGLTPRVLYQMPSTAICWSTYEFWKWFLLSKKEEEPHSSDKKVMELPSLTSASLYAVPVAFSAQAEPSMFKVSRT
ncbi:unnamed protein product [Nesidiocoris tenuis]|uniref:Mitochondrial carrier protein n=1 Tax=Nesidiocoris tenuis TaxID=355587 RepID=A0A6H5GAK4_9HEMI|nr:unnamed protein product [Nesidiocoris tenuis]